MPNPRHLPNLTGIAVSGLHKDVAESVNVAECFHKWGGGSTGAGTGKTLGSRWKTHGGRWKTIGGRWKTIGGRWKVFKANGSMAADGRHMAAETNRR